MAMGFDSIGFFAIDGSIFNTEAPTPASIVFLIKVLLLKLPMRLVLGRFAHNLGFLYVLLLSYHFISEPKGHGEHGEPQRAQRELSKFRGALRGSPTSPLPSLSTLAFRVLLSKKEHRFSFMQ